MPKLTDMTHEQLVDMVARDLCESVMDDSANDLRDWILDLETGKTKPVCTWTDDEIRTDLVESHSECLHCDGTLTLDTTYAYRPANESTWDAMCEACYKELGGAE